MVRGAVASKSDLRLKVAFALMAAVLTVLAAQPIAAALAEGTDIAATDEPSHSR